MPNPRLTPAQRTILYQPLFEKIKADLELASGGDPELLWVLRRKIAKELIYLERSRPADRKKLKIQKFKEQNGLCAICGEVLPSSGAELDRKEAIKGYTPDNTNLVHHDCHIKDQEGKGFA